MPYALLRIRVSLMAPSSLSTKLPWPRYIFLYRPHALMIGVADKTAGYICHSTTMPPFLTVFAVLNSCGPACQRDAREVLGVPLDQMDTATSHPTTRDTGLRWDEANYRKRAGDGHEPRTTSTPLRITGS